jgi:hypothetical protein
MQQANERKITGGRATEFQAQLLYKNLDVGYTQTVRQVRFQAPQIVGVIFNLCISFPKTNRVLFFKLTHSFSDCFETPSGLVL